MADDDCKRADAAADDPGSLGSDDRRRLRAALTAPLQGSRRKLVILNAFLDGKETDPELYENQYCALKVKWPEQAVKEYIAFLKRADVRGDVSSKGTDAAKIGRTYGSEGDGLSDGDSSKPTVSLLAHQNAVMLDSRPDDSIATGAGTARKVEKDLATAGQVDLLNDTNARLYGRHEDDEAEGTAAGAGSVRLDLAETAKQSQPKRKR